MWQPEPELLQHLDRAVDGFMATQKSNGQFGTEPWISTDQNVLWPLAVAWSQAGSSHYQDEECLDAIVRGGLALQEAQDEAGMWMFRKKDYSEWGPIRMPWAYSRWMRAFAVIRDAMPEAARRLWEEGLQLGYAGIAAEDMDRIHNIPAHHAMGLYCAGQVFERKDWCDQATDFLRQVAAAQSEDGWWAEHDGPVVAYNFVYADALGAYYTMSGDAQVLPALERAATYHAIFTYPDGSCVETIDGRNVYHDGIRLGNAGLTRSAAGRGWTAQQHRLFLATGQLFDADYVASMLAYAESGEAQTPPGARDVHRHRMSDGAIVERRSPWVACVSACTVDIPTNRFGQDRQNFVSLYHDDVGLVVGGGNTKLQPLWSTFTVGDPSLMRHEPGEEDPDFTAVPGLMHCPDAATLKAPDQPTGVVLHYGSIDGHVEVELEPELARIRLRVEGETTLATTAHLTLLPKIGQSLRLGEKDLPLEEGEKVDVILAEDGVLCHNGWKLTCAAGSRVQWPVLPHNPYRKDGHATIEESRIVLSLSLSPGEEGIVEVRVGP